MNKSSIGIFATAFVAVSGLSQAQSTAGSAPSSPSPLSPIYACADKTDPTERLACYDGAVAAIRAKEEKSEIVTFDKQRVEKVRREAFGFSLPSLPKLGLPAFGSGKKSGGSTDAATAANDVDIEEQTFVVTSQRMAGDRVVLTLENGQVWRLVEAGELNGPRRPPFNVTIRTAAMGSYILTVEGRNKGYRVRRVE